MKRPQVAGAGSWSWVRSPTLRDAGEDWLTMQQLLVAVPGDEDPAAVQLEARRLWEANEISRRSDGTYIGVGGAWRPSDDAEEVAA